MRVAAIDLGTNSTRLLVADVENGRLVEVARRLAITRLGEDVDRRGRLLPLPIARVRNCLTGYRRELELLGAKRTLAVGTSAIRDAENGEAFLGEIEWSYGFETALLSGHDEALLTFRGVSTDRALAGTTLIVDIGGGSTELVVGNGGGLRWHDTLDLGCVRQTERFLGSDPPGEADVAACTGAVSALLAERVPDAIRSDVRTAIGVAGTVTTMAALDLGLTEYDPERIHGHVLPTTAVERELGHLAGLPLGERRRVPGLEPERAPVIVAGAVILYEVQRHFGLEELEVSERDLLHGAALAAAELPQRAEGPAPPGAYTCC